MVHMIGPGTLQAPVRINDLLNAVKHVAAGKDRGLLLEAFPDLPPDGILPAGIPGDGILVDREYYTAKEVLIMDEQVRFI